MAEHLKIGRLGEKIALEHYIGLGFKHIESNYRSKAGEIDVIVKKGNVVHFVEVKSVSRGKYKTNVSGVPHGTWRPEENVHNNKLRKTAKTIQIWLSHRKYQGEWQFDVAAVYIDVPHGTSEVELIDNVIIE